MNVYVPVMVSAQYACLVSKKSHDAVVVEVRGYVGINRCQGVVQQVHCLVLYITQV